MIYSNLSDLLNILQKNSLFAKKKFGQNFLINPSILDSIITAAEIQNDDFIIEVGPGLGFLTSKLIPLIKNLLAIEIDPNLFSYLKTQLNPNPNLKIINQDILKTTVPNIPYKLVANIPYYITSPILNHFFQVTPPGLRPNLIVLLVQKEVAQKICTKDGSHSILSLQTQIFGKPEIYQIVKPENFYPIPKIESAILKIKTYPHPLINNFKIFSKLISATFQQKRKTMENSLKNNLHLSVKQLEFLFNNSQITPSTRPQQLSIQDWEKLTKIYSKLNLEN